MMVKREISGSNCQWSMGNIIESCSGEVAYASNHDP